MLSPNITLGSPSSAKFSHEETVLFIKKSIQTVDSNYSTLTKALTSYSDSLAQMQSKSLKLATMLEIIGESEADSRQKVLMNISNCMKQREICRGDLIQRLDASCIEPLSAYPALCGKLMDDLKSQKNAIYMQRKKRQEVEQIILKESGELGRKTSSKISKSQMALAESTGLVSAATETLQEGIYRFEDQKKEDLKSSLQELIYAEINYTAKTLEILTRAAAELTSL